MLGTVLFDLDGVVTNIDLAVERAHAIVVRRFGGALPAGWALTLAGEALESTCAAAINTAGICCSVDGYLDQFRKELFRTLKRGIHLTEGIIPLLRAVKLAGYKVGFVSSNDRRVVSLAISNELLNGLFDFSLAANDFLSPKPANDPYALAQQMTWASKYRYVTLESSITGASAAIAAGIPAIGVASGQKAAKLSGLGLPVVDSLTDTSLVFRLLTRHMASSGLPMGDYFASDRMFAGRRLLAVDARGTVLDPHIDAAAPSEVLWAIIELLESGVALAIITGSSICTVERLLLLPLRELMAARGADRGAEFQDVLVYTSHATHGWVCRNGSLEKLHGYDSKFFDAVTRDSLIQFLRAGPRRWHFGKIWIRPGQLNVHVDQNWQTRRLIASEISDGITALKLPVRIYFNVPSSKARIDISLSSKASGLADAQRRLGCADSETVVLADSLQNGGSDWPMIEGNREVIAIQTGLVAPPNGVVHGPGVGTVGATGWLRFWAGSRIDHASDNAV